MSLAVRELLAGRYCPSQNRALQLARDKANESCLMEELGLHLAAYATAMADALAFLHWNGQG
ncbi:hypothetical protein ISF_00382 [Cordyceps fumosorosea ARSEF 2679]|uniref:Uncharacterized protein n=1 Tax=Cordyceps fumosorosea (strain ARSEF 2679) TaxID=1081104 RepID=A0A168E811_CORFA|nr:hypothetical protein ISF_00382 [Cordyceps fumosorosea ARSEF 2679]OAA73481.1 hypothetical protein ISF_00382 [Cordyceps fumosorosea ARSEF 2679]